MNALFVSPVPYYSSLSGVIKYVFSPLSWALSMCTWVFLKIWFSVFMSGCVMILEYSSFYGDGMDVIV